MVPSCMLGAGIRGTYGSKLRNFINPLGPRVTNINFSPNSIRSSRVTVTLFFFIRILFSRARLNILIFPPILGCKYSCIILSNSL